LKIKQLGPSGPWAITKPGGGGQTATCDRGTIPWNINTNYCHPKQRLSHHRLGAKRCLWAKSPAQATKGSMLPLKSFQCKLAGHESAACRSPHSKHLSRVDCGRWPSDGSSAASNASRTLRCSRADGASVSDLARGSARPIKPYGSGRCHGPRAPTTARRSGGRRESSACGAS
jgi:hypothetical protein